MPLTPQPAPAIIATSDGMTGHHHGHDHHHDHDDDDRGRGRRRNRMSMITDMLGGGE
jgi:hypothetical protein